MKRLLLLASLFVFGYFAGRYAVDLFLSDETRIRNAIEEMEEGFNEGSGKRATSGLADTWLHEGQSMRRDDLRGYLLAEFQQQRSRKARRLTLRVDVLDDLLIVEVDGDRAEATIEAFFEKLRGESWEPLWRMRVQASLEKGEDGWKIVRTAKEDLEGNGLRG